MGRIDGKAALVTGGTRGIGFAIAQALLAEGAAVFICGRTDSAVEKAVAALSEGTGRRAAGMACDVRKHAQVRSLLAEMERRMGGIDILINNAGVGLFCHVEDLAPEQWSDIIETNLSGVFYCCHEAVPIMKRRGGGWIINIGSLAGKNAFAGGAAYNASKFGLVGFSEALMQEVRHDHIRVSYVMPGSVNTAFGGGTPQNPAVDWKLQPGDVATVVTQALGMDPRALPSRIELRPSEPQKK